ncbi:hypothetical protein VDGL01_05269 [Verticillium dahliae]
MTMGVDEGVGEGEGMGEWEDENLVSTPPRDAESRTWPSCCAYDPGDMKGVSNGQSTDTDDGGEGEVDDEEQQAKSGVACQLRRGQLPITGTASSCIPTPAALALALGPALGGA